MSVFDFPRIHFSGTQLVNPGTGNNDSATPGEELTVTSDTELVQPMTRGMKDDQFRKWMTSLDANGLLRCQWNYYGDFTFRFLDVRIQSVQFSYSELVTDKEKEPLIGGQVYLNNALMIDNNPEGYHTSQIFSESLEIRAPEALGGTGTFVSRKPTPATTLWLNWYRNVSYHGLFGLPPLGAGGELSSGGAGGASASFQCGIEVHPKDLDEIEIRQKGREKRSADKDEVLHKLIAGKKSRALRELVDFLKNESSGAQGLICHYNLYLCFPHISDTKLAKLFAQGKQTENPAYGRVVGTIAPWLKDEPAAIPLGRFLKPARSYENPYRPDKPYYLSPAVASYNREKRHISLDLANCLPEDGPEGLKYSLGTITLGLREACKPNQDPSNNQKPIKAIGEVPNDRDTYEKMGGIYDISCEQLDPEDLQHLEDYGHELVLQTANAGALLYETEYMIAPDCECNYLDQLATHETWAQKDVTDYLDSRRDPELRGVVKLIARRRGNTPNGDTTLKVEQWKETPTGYIDEYGRYRYPLLLHSDTVTLTNGTGHYRLCPRNGSGVRVYRLVPEGIWPQDIRPDDFSRLRFQEFYINLRVLPYDDYSHLTDDKITFDRIYDEVFRYYSLILPAMNKRLEMNNPRVWDTPTAAQYVLRMTQPDLWGYYNYMPRTRDLSKYRRKLLRCFCRMVLKKFGGQMSPAMLKDF